MTNYRQWLLDEIDRINVLNDEIGYLLVSESSRIEVLQEALTKYDQSGIEELVKRISQYNPELVGSKQFKFVIKQAKALTKLGAEE